jgi:hypothetical protein
MRVKAYRPTFFETRIDVGNIACSKRSKRSAKPGGRHLFFNASSLSSLSSTGVGRRITRAWIGDERDNQRSSCSASDRGRRRQRFFYEGNKGKIVLHRGPGGTAEQSARFSEAGLVLQKIRLFITVFPDRILIKPHKMRQLVHQRDLHFSRQFGPLGKILF